MGIDLAFPLIVGGVGYGVYFGIWLINELLLLDHIFDEITSKGWG